MRKLLETIFDTILFICLCVLIVWVIIINMKSEPTEGAVTITAEMPCEDIDFVTVDNVLEFDWDSYIPMTENVVICDDSDELYPTRDEVTSLALTVVGEASNCDLRTQIAVMWTVLNRVDAGFGDTIMDVCSAESQFAGYTRALDRLDDEGFIERFNRIKTYCYDVIYAWKNNNDWYRNLPSNYLYFRSDAKHTTNYFLNEQNWKYIYKVDKAKSHRYKFDMVNYWEEDENYLNKNWLFEVNEYEG